MESSDNILKRIFRSSGDSITPASKPSNTSPEEGTCEFCGGQGIVLHGETGVPCPCMEQKRINNSFRYARMSRELMNCHFESFMMDYYRGTTPENKEHLINAQKALSASQDFCQNVLKNPHQIGLLFTGNVGSGKTFLAAAIANVLIQQQTKLLFLVVPDLLDELRASFGSKSETSEFDLLDIARTVPVLILDDLGAHNYTDWSRNRIYSILNYRMNEQLPTIITTNLHASEIETYLGVRT